MRRASSSSPLASSKCTGVRGRRKRDESARESLKDRKRRVLERVVGEVVDDEAIAVVPLNVDGVRLVPRRVAQSSREQHLRPKTAEGALTKRLSLNT